MDASGIDCDHCGGGAEGEKVHLPEKEKASIAPAAYCKLPAPQCIRRGTTNCTNKVVVLVMKVSKSSGYYGYGVGNTSTNEVMLRVHSPTETSITNTSAPKPETLIRAFSQALASKFEWDREGPGSYHTLHGGRFSPNNPEQVPTCQRVI